MRGEHWGWGVRGDGEYGVAIRMCGECGCSSLKLRYAGGVGEASMMSIRASRMGLVRVLESRADVYLPHSIQTWALEEARRRLEAEGILPDSSNPSVPASTK